MTGLEVPIYAAIGIVSLAMGAGGTVAVVKRQTNENQKDIVAVEQRLNDHERQDDQAFKEIMRSLGRIEGTLTELNRSK